MNRIKPLPFEFDHNATPFEVIESLKIYNFATLNGILRSKIYRMDQLRDDIEMADFFPLNYKSDKNFPSNKDLALKRFTNLETTRKVPYLKLENLPLGQIVIEKILKQKPFPGLFDLHMPNSIEHHIHSTILRPAQNAKSNRSTEWKWHQDIKFHRSLSDFSIWVPLVNCGKDYDAPSLQFIIAPGLKKILKLDEGSGWCLPPHLQTKVESECEKYAPNFSIGDCIIFNTYALHKTYALPGMNKDRTSVDIRVTFKN